MNIAGVKYREWNIKIKKLVLVADIISGLLLLLFLYTALSKLLAYQQFSYTLSQSPLLKRAGSIVAWVLPLLEIAIAIILFIPRLRMKGLWAAAILLMVFTIYLAYMVLFAPTLPCNCAGVLEQLQWWQHIIFNIVMILLSITGIALYHKTRHRPSRSPP